MEENKIEHVGTCLLRKHLDLQSFICFTSDSVQASIKRQEGCYQKERSAGITADAFQLGQPLRLSLLLWAWRVS